MTIIFVPLHVLSIIYLFFYQHTVGFIDTVTLGHLIGFSKIFMFTDPRKAKGEQVVVAASFDDTYASA